MIPEIQALKSLFVRARIKQRLGKGAFALFRLVFLLSVSYIILYPLFFMVSSSLMAPEQILDPSVVWLPKQMDLNNFLVAFQVMGYAKALGTTMLVLVVSALVETFTCSLPAYGMARFRFREGGVLFAIVILTTLVPAQMYIIPLFLNFRDFDVLGLIELIRQLSGKPIEINLINTPLVFYLPSLFGVGLRSGLFIFIYRQFFMGMPKELEEAAWIDGAGPLRTFIRVVLPSSNVAILTVCILSVIWHWNDYYLSVMYFSENFPLAVALSEIESSLKIAGYGSESTIQIGFIMAGCLLFVLPILVMYLVLQKRFIASIDRVGIVG